MENEIEIENEQLPKLVTQLVEKLKNDVGLDYPLECTKFLERCLRVKDLNLDKAFKLVVNFRKASTSLEHRRMKQNFRMSCAQKLFDAGVVTILKSRDTVGHQILFTRIGKWNPSEIDYDQMFGTLALLNCWMVGQSLETQRKGMVYLFDLTNFGMTQLRGFKMSNMKELASIAENSTPAKIKGIHIVFHPRIFGPLFQILKPFLKEKLCKRMHLHGDSLPRLHQHLKPEILPGSLGGCLGEDEAVDVELLKRFTKQDSFAKEILTYGCPKQ